MSIDIKIPEIGESISEVVISEWLKAEGDHVDKDEDIVVVESDKATVTIPAPESGMVSKILKQSGGTASVGEAIGRLEEEDSPAQTEGAQTIDAAQTKKLETDDATLGETGPRGVGNKAGQTQSKKSASRGAHRTEKEAGLEAEKVETRETEPAAQERLDEFDTADSTEIEYPHSAPGDSTPESSEIIAATGGANKTIKQTDERPDRYADTREAQQPGPRPKPALSKDISYDRTGVESEDRKADINEALAVPERPSGRRETVVPMSAIRRRIAERLVRAQQETAFLSTFNEIDMSTVHATRQRYQEIFQKRHGIKLGFMPFFVKAAIEALQFIPQVNAEIRNTDIVYRNYYDIGVAVGGGKGLVVPILRNAESMSFAEIEQAIQSFARKAENRQLKPDDLEGGTFTISNGGIYGSLLSTPIINSPQSAVLGMHAIEDRPVARDGQVVVRPMMYIALTYDHRIIDGREAVTFLKRIKDCVETPARILLQV